MTRDDLIKQAKRRLRLAHALSEFVDAQKRAKQEAKKTLADRQPLPGRGPAGGGDDAAAQAQAEAVRNIAAERELISAPTQPGRQVPAQLPGKPSGPRKNLGQDVQRISVDRPDLLIGNTGRKRPGVDLLIGNTGQERYPGVRPPSARGGQESATGMRAEMREALLRRLSANPRRKRGRVS